ncbi:MAG: YaaL family protein [Sedimentibacter sp.]|uniref:YaaL family protein n=1 Tax=Sedimentibacter sp. TaxID=1960295 RepID=UPI00315851A4
MNTISNKEFNIGNILGMFKQSKKEKPKNDCYINIENAKKEWEDAKNIFENVSEPDLVDYAIYNVDAAEKKYIYLLRQIKNGNTN